jgi:hypothetical protein
MQTGSEFRSERDRGLAILSAVLADARLHWVEHHGEEPVGLVATAARLLLDHEREVAF